MVRRLRLPLIPTLLVVLALALPSLASASTAGPPMPWDTGLQNLVDNLTGIQRAEFDAGQRDLGPRSTLRWRAWLP